MVDDGNHRWGLFSAGPSPVLSTPVTTVISLLDPVFLNLFYLLVFNIHTQVSVIFNQFCSIFVLRIYLFFIDIKMFYVIFI